MANPTVDQDSLVIDGVRCPLVRPDSVEEVEEIVRAANAKGEALYPTGSGTKLYLGVPPARAGLAVTLRGVSSIIDYPARDMTITVQSGMTVAELQVQLAEENQRLPIDVPNAENATLGGILATNTSGARRLGCGTLRDYLIGITVVNDEGKQTKAGGRVVKNVAGYDLGKLYIGSLGTLGIITQATLKVVPKPEQDALVILQTGSDDLDRLLLRLHKTKTRPVCIELLNTNAIRLANRQYALDLPEAEWLVIVGYESNAAAVNWQVQQLIVEVQTDHPLDARVGPVAAPLWQALQNLPDRSDSKLSVNVATLPSRCADTCRNLSSLADDIVLHAHAGNGIIHGHLASDVAAEEAIDFMRRTRDLLGTNGSAVVARCPSDWKRDTFIWGKPRADVTLMRRIKEKMDPKNLFNPGRFYGSI